MAKRARMSHNWEDDWFWVTVHVGLSFHDALNWQQIIADRHHLENLIGIDSADHKRKSILEIGAFTIDVPFNQPTGSEMITWLSYHPIPVGYQIGIVDHDNFKPWLAIISDPCTILHFSKEYYVEYGNRMYNVMCDNKGVLIVSPHVFCCVAYNQTIGEDLTHTNADAIWRLRVRRRWVDAAWYGIQNADMGYRPIERPIDPHATLPQEAEHVEADWYTATATTGKKEKTALQKYRAMPENSVFNPDTWKNLSSAIQEEVITRVQKKLPASVKVSSNKGYWTWSRKVRWMKAHPNSKNHPWKHSPIHAI